MSSPVSLTTIRRSRIIVLLLLLVGVLFFLIPSWELPASLKEAGAEVLSRANIAYFAKQKDLEKEAAAPTLNVDEIYGLLHLVTSDQNDEAYLSQIQGLDGTIPLDMSLYAPTEPKIDWNKTVERINKKYPVVVFSKSYCPYSRAAKKLLETYNLHPAPKYVEVDLRPDTDIIKAILTRLTGHKTFPNVILCGHSVGGSDDLRYLHAQRLLTGILEKAGAVLRNEGSGK